MTSKQFDFSLSFYENSANAFSESSKTTPVDIPFDETAPAEPQDPYGVSKLKAERGRCKNS
jgi:UDP-glucose 4-epimerase